ncbi:zinc-finger domain-containing protein [Paraurantiacibacter namhicola]|uniref:Zinc-finger domain protein n=1 Tax=Paraurantiacibacter namhicola TaxID=645517 RepID=A0A1C7D6A9_9SPHN|nr:zinc-finger domain-containing protein [Paraurantiacibacter namhicola]ANU06990.1 Zinc-finger domain protein [Paraurantiacibacter namhicola]
MSQVPKADPKIIAGDAPETTVVETRDVWCDGAGDIRNGENFRSAALGHPRVWMKIDEKGYADCGYCDRRFVLEGGPHQQAGIHELEAGDLPAPADGSVA